MATPKPDGHNGSAISTLARTQPAPQGQHQPKISSQYTIAPVRTPSDLRTVATLFASYAASLNLDLSFQDFANEMASLPGKYASEQGGELLIARRTPPSDGIQAGDDESESEAIGCVALRSLTSEGKDVGVCEMKRLYTAPGARGMGLGRALARGIIQVAKQRGYVEMRLDTLPTMGTAQKLYTELGFQDIEKYCANPVEGVRYLGLNLKA